MEDLLEKYEKLYFSALEGALDHGNAGPIPVLRTLKTISKIHTVLLDRLQLLLTHSEKASTTSSETSSAQCSKHGEPLVNEAFFKCGCRYVTPPVIGFKVHETIELTRPYGSPGMNPKAIGQLKLEEAAKLTILGKEPQPPRSPKPCSEGCDGWIISDAGNGPQIERCDECWSGVADAPNDEDFEKFPVCQEVLRRMMEGPGPEVLGDEEYDQRQIDMVMTAVKNLSTRRLMWLVDENNTKDERVLDPPVVCWVNFARAEIERRRDAQARGRKRDWVED